MDRRCRHRSCGRPSDWRFPVSTYDQFNVPRTVLGKVVGEAIGYALTATFTVLVVLAITRRIAPRWLTYVGYAAAVLIATGVLIPLGIDAARLTNFAGYVAWCLWLIAMAVALWRSPAPQQTTPRSHRRPRPPPPNRRDRRRRHCGCNCLRAADESASLGRSIPLTRGGVRWAR
jgi:hypothetical protein